MKPIISVVIPTFNSSSILITAINSLLKQTVIPFEILVIDNASTNSTCITLRKKFVNKIKILRNKKNLGVSGGRNIGIRSASKKSNYILFMDHDMVADKKMIETLHKGFILDISIGIVTPKIYYLSDRKRIWSAGTGMNLWTGQVLFRGGEDLGQFEIPSEVQVAPATFMVKKKVLDKVKKFDLRYFATYEDTDFCFRAKKAGFKTFFVPKAIAYHDLPMDKTAESLRLLTRAYWVGRNRVLFMKDFGNNFFVFLLFLPIFGLYYGRLSLMYNKPSAFYKFVKGTIDGLRGK